MAPGGGLFAAEPATVLKLARVHVDLGADRLSVAADHQRVRHRPGLGRVIVHTADADAGFFLGFAPHRLFHGFARFQEAGQAGIHAGREMRAAAEQAPGVLDIDGEHDDHRIRSRKQHVAAGRAFAPVAAGTRLGLHVASPAMAVRHGPGHQADALRQLAKFVAAHQSLDIDRPVVDCLDGLRQFVRVKPHRHRQSRRVALGEPEQNDVAIVWVERRQRLVQAIIVAKFRPPAQCVSGKGDKAARLLVETGCIE